MATTEPANESQSREISADSPPKPGFLIKRRRTQAPSSQLPEEVLDTPSPLTKESFTHSNRQDASQISQSLEAQEKTLLKLVEQIGSMTKMLNDMLQSLPGLIKESICSKESPTPILETCTYPPLICALYIVQPYVTTQTKQSFLDQLIPHIYNINSCSSSFKPIRDKLLKKFRQLKGQVSDIILADRTSIDRIFEFLEEYYKDQDKAVSVLGEPGVQYEKYIKDNKLFNTAVDKLNNLLLKEDPILFSKTDFIFRQWAFNVLASFALCITNSQKGREVMVSYNSNNEQDMGPYHLMQIIIPKDQLADVVRIYLAEQAQKTVVEHTTDDDEDQS